MKSTKTNKGITLVALILTIVVLLILAVVSINAIQNTEIINHAINAAKKYNQAQKDENTLLGEYNSSFEGTDSEEEEGVVTFTVKLNHNGSVVGTRTYSGVKGTKLSDWIGSQYNTDEWEYVDNIVDGLRFRMWLTEDEAKEYGYYYEYWSEGYGAWVIEDDEVIIEKGMNLNAYDQYS